MQVTFPHVMQECYTDGTVGGALGQRRRDRRFWMAYKSVGYDREDVCCAVMDDFGNLRETDGSQQRNPFYADAG